jgi:hypothetical protein
MDDDDVFYFFFQKQNYHTLSGFLPLVKKEI